jgi:hypothetical protein
MGDQGEDREIKFGCNNIFSVIHEEGDKCMLLRFLVRISVMVLAVLSLTSLFLIHHRCHLPETCLPLFMMVSYLIQLSISSLVETASLNNIRLNF